MYNPAEIQIIHITHIGNLSSILKNNALYSDKLQLDMNLCERNIGMETIKQRRLKLPVHCNPDTMVGEYVPFYFYTNSSKLYFIHKDNCDLTYFGGEENIIHLVSYLKTATDWANENNKLWAFSKSNAGAYFCNFYNSLNDLDKINWKAVQSKDWINCKEEKQAEFLIQEQFAFYKISYIGVYDVT